MDYNEEDNNSDSCKFHTGSFNKVSLRFNCCGEKNLSRGGIPCKIGFHIEDLKEKINIIFK